MGCASAFQADELGSSPNTLSGLHTAKKNSLQLVLAHKRSPFEFSIKETLWLNLRYLVGVLP